MRLVLVESPTKSKTISKFLGHGYKVLSSYGHIRDLPENEFGIDIENNFAPKYVVIPKAKKNLQLLKKEVKEVDLVILATDEDREGEAIAWHLCYLLNLNEESYQRIVFHEITKQALKEALESPRKIDINLVNAQQARRILDRIVGYKLSPFLWKKVARGLSAGRVQSVAVRLIVEREREIEKFVPQEYWTLEAILRSRSEKKIKFSSRLVKKNGKTIPKPGIPNKKEVEKILQDLKGAEYRIVDITKKELKRFPLPPFTTSTLQQTAWNKFRWTARFTMNIAQQLYEKGFTTYHRTDSLNISNLALNQSKKFIIANYGRRYYQFRKYKTKTKGAQEAHEAIRPTFVENTPEELSKKLDNSQSKLYQLIWNRFIASQMSPAVFESTIINIQAQNYLFVTSGQTLTFDGFTKVYEMKYEEETLTHLEKGEIVDLVKLNPAQHFTQPPPRYTEATLIKTLEENGIGRPSTYAPILSTIQERNYIEKDEQKRLKPTEMGRVVNDILVRHFPQIVDINFTAVMEGNLDEIAQGKREWVKVIREFYEPFKKNLDKKYQDVSKKEFTEYPTDKKCPLCGSEIIIRLGKFGRFYACSRFPKCKYTESMQQNQLEIICPKCKVGKIMQKFTKNKKIFYGCSSWPKCDFALWDKPTGQICKECGYLMVQNKKKSTICSNKECKSNLKEG